MKLNKLSKDEEYIIEQLRAVRTPVILAINKIDMVKNKEDLMARIAYLSSLHEFDAIVPVSASDGNGLNLLLDELKKQAVEGEHFFPDDTLTDQPERVLAAEIIREKMLRLLDKEIPHGAAVSIEKMRERDDGSLMDVEAIIRIRPEIVIVDELAHTNVEGSLNEKRWQDVLQLLDVRSFIPPHNLRRSQEGG